MAEPGGQNEEVNPVTESQGKPQSPHRVKKLVRRGVAATAGVVTLAAAGMGIGILPRPGESRSSTPSAEVQNTYREVPLESLLLKAGEAPTKWDTATEKIEVEGYLTLINTPDKPHLAGIYTYGLYPKAPESLDQTMTDAEFRAGANEGKFLPVYVVADSPLGQAIKPPDYHSPSLNPLNLFRHDKKDEERHGPPADGWVSIKGDFSALSTDGARQAKLEVSAKKDNPEFPDRTYKPTFDELLQNREAFYMKDVAAEGYLQFVGLLDSSYPAFDKHGKQITHARIDAVYALYDHTVNQADVPKTIEEVADAAGKRKLVIVTETTERNSAPDDKLRADITANARSHNGWAHVQGEMGRWLTNGLAKDNPPPKDHADVIRRSSASIMIPGSIDKKGSIQPIPAPTGK